MKTKKEVSDFLASLQWERFAKSELQRKLQEFFETDNTLEDSTDQDCKELDYAFIFTNGKGACTSNFIDVEIYYLKMRQRNHLIVTSTEILMYEK